MISAPRPHDLIHVLVEPAWFHFEQDAEAALEHLRACPLVVVRRGSMRDGCVPIGVRGSVRSERYAGWMNPAATLRLDRPADLVLHSSSSKLPAFEAFATLCIRWRNLNRPWGPTGSMGFELASGRATVTASSDLDIQIRADRPFTRAEARLLWKDTLDLPASLDVVIETPCGGFALAEYASSSTCMLRTPGGPVLTANPWLNVQAAA